MNRSLFAASLILGTLAFTACSTVGSRIAGHRAAYDTWPPAIQQQVSAGEVAVGFTREQVQVALGDPDGVFSRTATTGSFEVWSYRDRRPVIGIGIGAASFHGGSAYGGGISATTGHRGERLRITFDASGRVSSIERFRR